jgi:hypothetical protein
MTADALFTVKDLADKYGNGHPEAVSVLAHFVGTLELNEDRIEHHEGRPYFFVGRNSSHSFYVGWDENGQMYKAVFCYDESPQWTVDKVNTLAGCYLGHF